MTRYRTKAYVELPLTIEVEANSAEEAYEMFREEGREHTVTFAWDSFDCYIPHWRDVEEVTDA